MKDVRAFQRELIKAAELAKSDQCAHGQGRSLPLHALQSHLPAAHGTAVGNAGALRPRWRRCSFAAAVDGGRRGSPAVDWGSTYGLMLDMANRIEPVLREWRAQAQAYLEEGRSIPGWKLVDKRATRRVDQARQIGGARLARMGLDEGRAHAAYAGQPAAGREASEDARQATARRLFRRDFIRQHACAGQRSASVYRTCRHVIASLATALSSLQGWRDYEPEEVKLIGTGEPDVRF